MAVPVRIPQLGPKARVVVRYAGYFLLALVTLIFAFQATFPIDRAVEKLEEVTASKFDLTIGHARRGIMPGTFYFENVLLKTRPKQEDLEKAYAITDPKERDKAVNQLIASVYIDEIKVSAGILAGIGGTASADFKATIGGGTLRGSLAFSKDNTSIRIVGEDLPSQQLPMREVLSNLPMSGNVDLDVALEVPTEKLKTGKTGPNWQRAEGEIEFSCPSGCVIGDGKSKLKFKLKNARSQAFAGEGTDFGTLRIQSLLAKIEIKDGKLELTKFDTKSEDIQLYVDFSMTLAQDINDSQVNGCLRFKGTEALRKREPRTFDQFALTGGARAADGLDNIKLMETFKNVAKRAILCGPGAPAGSTERPSLPSTSATTPPGGRGDDNGRTVSIPPPAPAYEPTPPPTGNYPAPGGGDVGSAPPPSENPATQPVPEAEAAGSAGSNGSIGYPTYPGSGAPVE